MMAGEGLLETNIYVCVLIRWKRFEIGTIKQVFPVSHLWRLLCKKWIEEAKLASVAVSTTY
jgi:hypothetical protein